MGSNTETTVTIEVKDKKRGRVVVKALVPPDICQFAYEQDDVSPVALCVAHSLVAGCSHQHLELGPILLAFEVGLGMHRTADILDSEGETIPLDDLNEA